MKKLKIIKWDEQDYRPYVWLVMRPGSRHYILSAHLTFASAVRATQKISSQEREG